MLATKRFSLVYRFLHGIEMDKMKRRNFLALLGGGLTVSTGSLLFGGSLDPYRVRKSIARGPTEEKFIKGQPDLSAEDNLFAVLVRNEREAMEKLRYRKLPNNVREALSETSDVAFWVIIGAVFEAEDSLGVEEATFEESSIEIPVSVIPDPDHNTQGSDPDELGKPRFHYEFVGYTPTLTAFLSPDVQSATVYWQSSK